MEYEVIRQLKQSKKSTVSLVQEKGGGRMFVRKVLAGRHPVYQMLQKDSHPCLPCGPEGRRRPASWFCRHRGIPTGTGRRAPRLV
ncbi:hypothetical protein [uncultured Acetatifactor sp.]|uniref:hypothetical protein n=1 Tax=uncultured Acetatifactor sp. TaxID=1671927 RepID=UPI00262E1BD3|nr:hypothetical protein [uncultured Acetatifactor sp.]